MEKGKIIILNGVPSSGKTTLAKTLQRRLAQPYFNMDIDAFCMMSPERFNIDNFSVQHNFVSNMFHAVKVFSDIGFNLVVPCVFLGDFTGACDFLNKCVALLHTYPVLFVHVTCPEEEILRREQKRANDNRKVGDAAGLLSMLVPRDTYDITVNTFNETLDECADKINELLTYPDKFTAFKTLWSLMQYKI